MTATPSIQSSAPAISLATLREVLAELEPLHGQRAVRAANIVACRTIDPSVTGKAWYVQSESDPITDYIVCCALGLDCWSCSCKDWERRGVGLGACKHILAVKILRECEARERGAGTAGSHRAPYSPVAARRAHPLRPDAACHRGPRRPAACRIVSLVRDGIAPALTH